MLAYHYITQGHGDAAVGFLKSVVALEPNDTLSAQLLKMLQPASAATATAAAAAAAPAPAPEPQPVDVGKLTGNWVAAGPQNAQITLAIQDDGGFTWSVAAPGKPAMSITGKSTLADGLLTLAAQNSPAGALTGQVVRQDNTHFTFRATGALADDPGLKFARWPPRRNPVSWNRCPFILSKSERAPLWKPIGSRRAGGRQPPESTDHGKLPVLTHPGSPFPGNARRVFSRTLPTPLCATVGPVVRIAGLRAVNRRGSQATAGPGRSVSA